MKRILTLLALVALGGMSASAAQQAPSEADRFRPAATVKDIMQNMMDPSADQVWEAVSVQISATGLVEKVPVTEKEWAAVRKNAIMLMEAANLLMIPGRKIARPGDKSENPGIELTPEEIEKVLQKNPADWTAAARRLQDAMEKVLVAIEKKDTARLSDLGGDIDNACEQCHIRYWYPDERGRPAGGPPVRN